MFQAATPSGNSTSGLQLRNRKLTSRLVQAFLLLHLPCRLLQPPAIAEAAVQQCSFGHMLAAGSMPDPLLERDREQHWEQRMKTLQQQLRYWHGKLDKA